MKKLLVISILALSLTSCTWWNDRVKNFESNTNGLSRTIYIYSYTGQLLKTYKEVCEKPTPLGVGWIA